MEEQTALALSKGQKIVHSLKWLVLFSELFIINTKWMTKRDAGRIPGL